MSGRAPRIGLVSAWLSRSNGGVFEAVVAHAELVRAAGFHPVVLGLADRHSPADAARFGDAEVIAAATAGPRQIGYAPGLPAALRRAGLDLIHLHGIWTEPSRAASRWAAATGRPYLISPHGMLDPWIVGRGRAKKWLARRLFESRSWRRASRFHALTGREADDIAAATGRAGAAVIPNPAPPVGPARSPGPPTFLYLGRIHPKKNVDGLVQAWRRVARARPPGRARLIVAGWGEPDHVGALKAQIGHGPGDGVSFIGPVFGQEKAQLLGDARFLCLPSHSEGLPMAILEAWAAGTPSLMSAHCHLSEGFRSGAAIDTGVEVSAIAQAIERALDLPEEGWAAMSAAALRLAGTTFSRESVAGQWRALYGELLERPERAAQP